MEVNYNKHGILNTLPIKAEQIVESNLLDQKTKKNSVEIIPRGSQGENVREDRPIKPYRTELNLT